MEVFMDNKIELLRQEIKERLSKTQLIATDSDEEIRAQPYCHNLSKKRNAYMHF